MIRFKTDSDTELHTFRPTSKVAATAYKNAQTHSHFKPSRQEFCHLRHRGADRRTKTHTLHPCYRRESTAVIGKLLKSCDTNGCEGEV